MANGLDHVVHAVRDLDAAAHLYRRLGFTTGARNRHPWGTHNVLVQLPGFFIEMLTVAEPEKLGDDGFSRLFGGYNQSFLERGEGPSLLILESQDASADAAVFAAGGIAVDEAMRFDREGKRPDGSAVRVGFSLAFAEDRAAPWIHFATCQQHHPENFWNPEFQHHANSATGIAGVVIVATDPAAHRDFLAAFTGRDVRDGDTGLVVDTARGTINVMTPSAFTADYAVAAPAVDAGARLAALRFAVADIAAAEDALAAGEIEARVESDRLVIDAGTAMGATVVFEEGR
jgi:catechol 2,3-dioxygenase-like lactoylglutathione lyase family enzyme